MDFVGRDALMEVQAVWWAEAEAGWVGDDRPRIGRDGYPVCNSVSGEKIGEVTSGSPGPFVKKNIALAYVPVEYAALDEVVAVEIRGAMVKAKVVATPFYKRGAKKTVAGLRKTSNCRFLSLAAE